MRNLVTSLFAIALILCTTIGYAQTNLQDNHFPVQAGRLVGNNSTDHNSQDPLFTGFFSFGTFGGWFMDDEGQFAWGFEPRHVAEGPILSSIATPGTYHMDVPWGLCQDSIAGQLVDLCFPQDFTLNPFFSREFLQPIAYAPLDYSNNSPFMNSNLADAALGNPSTYSNDNTNPYGCNMFPAGIGGNQPGCFDTNVPYVSAQAYTGTATYRTPVVVSDPFNGESFNGYLKKPRNYIRLKFKSGIPPVLQGNDWTIYHTTFVRIAPSPNMPFYELNGFHVHNGMHGAPVYIYGYNSNGAECDILLGHIIAGDAENQQAVTEGGRAIVQSWEYAEKPAILKGAVGQVYHNFEPAGSCIATQRKAFDATASPSPIGSFAPTMYAMDSNGLIPAEQANGYITNAVAPMSIPLYDIANSSTGDTWMKLIASQSNAINSIGVSDNGAIGQAFSATMDFTYVCSSLPEDIGYSDCTHSPAQMKSIIMGTKNSAGTTFGNYIYNTYGIPSAKITVEQEAGFDDAGAEQGVSVYPSGHGNVYKECSIDPWFAQQTGVPTCN